MKKLATGALVLLFIAGAGAGLWFLMNRTKQSPIHAVTDTTIPSDDLEIVTPVIDGLAGARKTITAETGGDITIRANDRTVYTVSIPAGSIQNNTEVQIAPFKMDSNNATLDRGVIIGPPGLSFSKPVQLIIYSPVEPVHPVVLKYAPLENQLTPQLINSHTGTVASTFITGAGAYLVSANSSRAEALSRITLSQQSPPPLSVLESARFLIKAGKQLSSQEMALVSRAINQLTALDEVHGERSINYKEVLSGNPVGHTSSGSPVSPSTIIPPLTVPPLVHQQEIDLITTVSEDPQASTLAVAYSLHLIKTIPVSSTREAQIQQKLQTRIAEKTIEQITPDYDFPDSYTGILPLHGFDWAITGQRLLALQFGIDPYDSAQLTGIAPTLEPLLKEDLTIGQAYCSVYHALQVKNEVCNSFDSKVEVARTELWLAASDFDPVSGPYESTATEEAELD